MKHIYQFVTKNFKNKNNNSNKKSISVNESRELIIYNKSEPQSFKASKNKLDPFSDSTIKFRCIINYEEVSSKDGAIYWQK